MEEDGLLQELPQPAKTLMSLIRGSELPSIFHGHLLAHFSQLVLVASGKRYLRGCHIVLYRVWCVHHSRQVNLSARATRHKIAVQSWGYKRVLGIRCVTGRLWNQMTDERWALVTDTTNTALTQQPKLHLPRLRPAQRQPISHFTINRKRPKSTRWTEDAQTPSSFCS